MIYHCKMTNGTELDVEAENAADAIQGALEIVRGSCVESCCAGNRSAGLFLGRINYEIPRHQPLPFKTNTVTYTQ